MIYEHKFKVGDRIRINEEHVVYKLCTLTGQTRYALVDPEDGVGCTDVIEGDDRGVTFDQIVNSCPHRINTLTDVDTCVTYVGGRMYNNGDIIEVCGKTYKLLILRTGCRYYATMIDWCGVSPLTKMMVEILNKDYVDERELKLLIGEREFKVKEWT